MDILGIRECVENNYNIHIEYIEKIKNVYKIGNGYKYSCLKVINYDFGHFLFIILAIRHLQKYGFKNTPKIMNTKSGQKYIKIENSFAYLTPWIDSRTADYDNDTDVSRAAFKLAELHKKSLGFKLTRNMNPRIYWFKWMETFNTRQNEILDFERRILNKENKSEFDDLYFNKIDDEIEKCRYSIGNLSESSYLEKMKTEVIKGGFCHHDYADHNVLISPDGDMNIIDFDYCILDTHLHDLASLLIRKMKHGKWKIKNALFVLDSYNSINKVAQEDIPIMAAFMEFPQEYWQIGIQYYWEKQRWSEEVFIKKLKKIFEDEEERQEFIEEFRTKKYN
ncbi:CotS family spore coat protein [Clostridium sp. LBM24168]